MDQNDLLLTRPEVARRFGIGLRQIRRACATGEISTYQVGGWQRILLSEAIRWIESKRLHLGRDDQEAAS